MCVCVCMRACVCVCVRSSKLEILDLPQICSDERLLDNKVPVTNELQ